jgi:transcriptional regulator with XRE-family HTH domain
MYNCDVMPQKSKLKLPPLDLGDETIGQRLARLRKERGYTQSEIAEQMGITQKLVSDYELDKLRPHPEMTIRFALAYRVTTDEILGIKHTKPSNGSKTSPKILRRLKKLEALPLSQQKFILKTIDSLIKAAEK